MENERAYFSTYFESSCLKVSSQRATWKNDEIIILVGVRQMCEGPNVNRTYRRSNSNNLLSTRMGGFFNNYVRVKCALFDSVIFFCLLGKINIRIGYI